MNKKKSETVNGTKGNHTHIKFTYPNGSELYVNKFTYKHVYPYAHAGASKIEYLIESHK